MSNRASDMLHLLEMELDVFEKGGFGRSFRDPQKQEPILKHSVSCINHWLVPEHSTDCCDGCLLLDFVPAEHQDQTVPCHFIPLDDKGLTVADLDRSQTDEELVETVKEWLRKTIARLKAEIDPAADQAKLDY